MAEINEIYSINETPTFGKQFSLLKNFFCYISLVTASFCCGNNLMVTVNQTFPLSAKGVACNTMMQYGALIHLEMTLR